MFFAKKKQRLPTIDHRYDFRFAFDILNSFAIHETKQSYELVVKLGTNPQKSEQNVRGICVLPEGTGKTKRFAFFSQNQKLVDVAAREGFLIISKEQLIQFGEQKFPFDILYSSQADLALLKPYAKFLGPKGLFPNVKSGTLVDESNIEREFAIAKAGKIELRNNEKAEIKCIMGKSNLNYEQLERNFIEILTFLN